MSWAGTLTPSSQESKKSALQDLFKTTLNKLMTGEVRVKNLDIDTSYVLGNENTQGRILNIKYLHEQKAVASTSL